MLWGPFRRSAGLSGAAWALRLASLRRMSAFESSAICLWASKPLLARFFTYGSFCA